MRVSREVLSHAAWSLTYLFFNTALKLPYLGRSPIAVLLSTSVATLGLGVHGSFYFDRTSWKGAVPGLVPAPTERKC